MQTELIDNKVEKMQYTLYKKNNRTNALSEDLNQNI